MLSKKEVKELYEESIKDYSIRKEKNEMNFADDYLDKSSHNLEVAGILDILSKDEEKRKLVGIATDSDYSDWIIVTSYYAMYLATTAALAKVGLKCTTHGSTILALEYNYCIEKKLLQRRYIEMIENASFGREDVQKLDNAMKGRVAVQYTVTKKYGEQEAKKILKDAKEFVNKITDILSANEDSGEEKTS